MPSELSAHSDQWLLGLHTNRLSQQERSCRHVDRSTTPAIRFAFWLCPARWSSGITFNGFLQPCSLEVEIMHSNISSSRRLRRGLILAGAALLLTAIRIDISAAAGTVPRNECANPPPGTIFCEDFENTNWRTVNGWAGSKLNNTSYVTDQTDQGPAQDASNHVVQLNVPGGIRDGSWAYKTFAPTNKVWVRWYQKFNTGWNFSDPWHGSGLDGGDTNFDFNSGNRPDGGTGQVTFWTEYYAPNGKMHTYSYYHGMYQDCPAQGSCYGDSFPCVMDSDGPVNYCKKDWDRPNGGVATVPTATANHWYCIEQYVDIGDPISDAQAAAGLANGEFRSYIDGVLMSQANNLHIRTSSSFAAPTELLLQLFFHQPDHNTAGTMFDNIVVANRRVGCGTTTPDVTPAVLSAPGPSGTVASPVSLSITSNEACTAKYSTAIRPYYYTGSQTTFGTTGGTSHSDFLSLATGTYTLYYQCADSAKNISNMAVSSFSVGTAPPRLAPPTNLRVLP